MSTAMKILFATDGSGAAAEAEGFLRMLLLPSGTEIQVVTVIGDLTWRVPDWVRDSECEWGDDVSGRAAAALERPGVSVTRAVRPGQVAAEILHAAAQTGTDLLVVGSRGLSGIARFLLGSVARNVASHAECPVLIARQPQRQLQHVLLAVDESEHAARAGTFLAGLPLPPETEFTVAHVSRASIVPAEEGPGYIDRLEQLAEEDRAHRRKAAQQLVDRFTGELTAAGRRASAVLREGDPATIILQLAADREVDLIVAGARGVSRIRGLVVGSVADRLMKNARCSLLIVH